QPVDRLRLLYQSREIGRGKSARIGEPAQCDAILLEVGDVRFVGNRNDDRFASFVALAKRELLDAIRRRCRQRIEVAIELSDVRQAPCPYVIRSDCELLTLRQLPDLHDAPVDEWNRHAVPFCIDGDVSWRATHANDRTASGPGKEVKS